MGLHPDKFSERAVYTQNIVRLIVHDDVVGDGIENFHPVPIGLVNAGEQARIFEGDGGMTGNCVKQLPVFLA